MENEIKKMSLKSIRVDAKLSQEEAAKKLAVSVGCVKPPEVEDVGYFGHYHDFTHTIHIWYGYPLYY